MKKRNSINYERIEIAGKISLAVVLILVFRLWHLQVISGSEYRELAQKNTIRPIRVEGIRGDIFDRYGRVLAENTPGYNIRIFRSGREDASRENWRQVFEKLGMEKELEDFPLKQYAYLKKDADWKTVSWLSERRAYLPELNIEVYPRRTYPGGEKLSHVLGYTGEINPSELERFGDEGYLSGDTIGKAGIERTMERYLRGEPGGRQVLVNAFGHNIDVLAEREPGRGNDIRLTVDYEIQKTAEEQLEGKKGAIIVMDPRNGEILAMASRPGFDPNILSGRLTRQQWREFLESEPVFESKSYQWSSPPGSVFKPVLAVAGLEEGIIKPEETVDCTGAYYLGRHRFRCWRREGHGPMDMKESLVYSCNVYFYTLGSRIGINTLVDYSRKFGFGRTAGLEISGESPGLFPDPQWKRQRYGVSWYPGDTVNVSIGQGFVLATPLQIATLYSALANGGTVYRPRLLHSILSPDGRVIWEGEPRVERELGISAETLGFVRQSLAEVVERGTGIYAATDRAAAAGKTGTAQNPHGENHAWFAGFAPAENASAVIVVLIEHGGQGSHAAAPIFKKIAERIFE